MLTKPSVRRSSTHASASFLLALALTGAACSSEGPVPTGDGDDLESAARALTVEEQAGVKAVEASLATPINNAKPQLRVKPILECVDKISNTTYVAHFGWDNTSAAVTIPVGPTNRFFPAPKDRAQGTTFAKGRQKDKVKVTFSDAYAAWILDGRYAIAVKSSPRCPSPPPLCPDSCDDQNPCTADVCNKTTGFQCTHRAMSDGTSCADKNVCNGAEICQGGVCKPGKAVTCTDDKNPCTSERCDANVGCVSSNVADGTSCTLAANCGAAGQKCKAGKCVANAAKCDDGNPCTNDVCGNGSKCSHSNVAAGTACQDMSTCNGAEVCNGKGVCGSPAPLVCRDDGNVCTVESCDVDLGCLSVPGNEGAACKTSDGKVGVCGGGVCAGTTTTSFGRVPACLTCEAGGVASGLCEPSLGCDQILEAGDRALCDGLDRCMRTTGCWSVDPLDCLCGTAKGTACASSTANGPCKAEIQAATKSSDPVANGTLFYSTSVPAGHATLQAACDRDVCSAECGLLACPSGRPRCDDNNPCTLDGCAADGSCASHPAGNEGAACTSPSGAAGKCAQGTCLDPQCQSSDPCKTATFVNGGCVIANAPDGKTCDDGRRCTTGDVCGNGTCVGQAVVCPPPPAGCGQATCSEATGTCQFPPGSSCGGRTPACLTCERAAVDKGDCDPAIGCNHIADAADRALCEALDSCMRATACWAADPIDCLCGTAKGTACASTAANGACKAQVQAATKSTDPVVNGTMFYSFAVPAGFATQQGACDRDFCPAVCAGLPCQPGGSDCDDRNPCTVDSCALPGGCTHVAGNEGAACTAASGVPGACAAGSCRDPLCQSSDPCKTAVFSNGSCVIANAPDGTTCSDAFRCTTGDVCKSGVCDGQPVVCAGSATCPGPTGCNEATGSCEFLPGNRCARSAACSACEQGGIATGDCDPSIGCSHIANAADRALCEALDTCMRATGCWTADPLDCLCGTAIGGSCASTSANGACKAEIQAATKTTDPVANGTLFYSFSVPAGYATQRVACDKDVCATVCAASACQPGGTDCDDKNPCTIDSCLATGGCGHVAGNDGAVCSAGSGVPGTCAAGACRDPLCQSSNPCKTAVFSNGACMIANVPDGTVCSDGLRCTLGDVCGNGICGGRVVTCGGNPACTTSPSCNETTGTCVYPPGTPCSRPAACLTCEQDAIGSGDCDPRIGCSHIADAADRALCEALDRCMRATGCWQRDPVDCLCGTAVGTACASPAANGLCRAEIQAATKSTDPLANGTRFYDLAYPAAFATQQGACDRDLCQQPCKLLAQ